MTHNPFPRSNTIPDLKQAAEPEEKKRQDQKLLLLEKTELFMKEIGIPEAFALRSRNQYLAEIYGCPIEKDEDGADVLICRLTDAVESRESGEWKRIPEDIWLATMRCFPRFISEYRRSYGRDGFDRGSWTVRQSNCCLFRVGELEYELFEEGDCRAISLHIPSDAQLEPVLLNESVRQAHDFLAAFYPDWKALPVICESWLLSPKLRELLPPESRILRFQNAFDIIRADPDDSSAIEWVFYVAEGQRASVKPENLPEDTSLQRKMKKMLLTGENPGNARGILTNRFQ